MGYISSVSHNQPAMVVSWIDFKALNKIVHKKTAILGDITWIFYQLEILETSINILTDIANSFDIKGDQRARRDSS